MTLKKFGTERSNQKWLLIQTQQNKLKKSFFSKKPLKDLFILILTAIDLLLEKTKIQIYFGLKLDKIQESKLSFENHAKNRGIEVLKKSNDFLFRDFYE